MQIRTVVAPLLSTNCYVVSDRAGRCVVVDPGYGVVEGVARLVEEHRLEPRAVLATHGHVDHTWSAAALSDVLGVPFLLHEADLHRVQDPFGTLGPLGRQVADTAAALGEVYRVPARVAGLTVAPDGTLVVARAEEGALADLGFTLRGMHAPGHTQGSTLYLLDAGAQHASPAPDDAFGPGPSAHEDQDGPVALTGDVLFAGSVGRTDLPGGDQRVMERTLRAVAALDPTTRVLPGHGPASRLSAELRTNPYLRMLG